MSSQCSCCYVWYIFWLVRDRERQVMHLTSPLQSYRPCIGFWHYCARSRAVVPETMCRNISKGIFPPYLFIAICLYAVFSDGPFFYTYSYAIGYKYPDCMRTIYFLRWGVNQNKQAAVGPKHCTCEVGSNVSRDSR